ncbi:hypothetical protein [Nonomuraea dietziae]|uniref:hypothetical protein n=1 Tax=Nonomuraea dietziae TaxID=65515 RepID=UPI0033FC1338
MSGDLVTLANDISPYVTAAVSAYGGAVLARAQEDAADATVTWGRRILQRVFGTRETGDETPEVLQDLSEDPDDSDLQAALRVQLRKALMADPALAEDVRGMLQQAMGPTTNIMASGERSIAAHTISGTAFTGDHLTINRELT